MASSSGDPGGEGKETSNISVESSSKPAPSSATATHASTSLARKTSSSLVPQKRKRELSSNFESVMCEIHVGTGDEKTVFPVHKKVFVKASKYFKAAFDGGFSESVSGILRLPEEDPELFAEVVRFVYRGSVDLLDETIFFPSGSRVKLALGFPLVFPLYVAFEKYQLEGLLKGISRNWHEFTHSSEWRDYMGKEFLRDFSPEVVNWVYANTVEGSLARQCAVQMIQHHLFHCNSAEVDWLECFIETPEIAVDLTRYLMKFVLQVRDPDENETNFEY